jgi:hypothetical protein
MRRTRSLAWSLFMISRKRLNASGVIAEPPSSILPARHGHGWRGR